MHLTDGGVQDKAEGGEPGMRAQAIRFFFMLLTAGADSQSLWL